MHKPSEVTIFFTRAIYCATIFLMIINYFKIDCIEPGPWHHQVIIVGAPSLHMVSKGTKELKLKKAQYFPSYWAPIICRDNISWDPPLWCIWNSSRHSMIWCTCALTPCQNFSTQHFFHTHLHNTSATLLDTTLLPHSSFKQQYS